MIIYKTTNTINNKFYIGKDTRNSKSYLGSGLLLINAINKYGKENFKKEVLQICYNQDELNIAESFWIKKLNATNRKIAYNIADGGQGGNLGIVVNKRISIGVSNSMKKRTIDQKNKTLSKFYKTIANRTLKEKKVLFDKMSIIKKGQIPWNKGTKGVCKSWNKNLKMSDNAKTNLSNARSRAISTPYGNFKNAKECGLVIKRNMTTIHIKCKSTKELHKQWFYI